MDLIEELGLVVQCYEERHFQSKALWGYGSGYGVYLDNCFISYTGKVYMVN